jgi:hypothetical protein
MNGATAPNPVAPLWLKVSLSQLITNDKRNNVIVMKDNKL